MDIKENLKALVQYIKKRVINGEYTILKINSHVVDIMIDDYRFELWIGENPSRHFSMLSKFPLCPELNMLSKSERSIGWENLRGYVENNEKRIKRERRKLLLEELERLEKD